MGFMLDGQWQGQLGSWPFARTFSDLHSPGSHVHCLTACLPCSLLAMQGYGCEVPHAWRNKAVPWLQGVALAPLRRRSCVPHA